MVQSTTSTQNSGLFDYLLPIFTAKTGIEVRVVAVGTGQAIKNAENGDGDVLFVHAKPSEEKFVAAGQGVERFDVMYNDFVIVGPPSDPAGVAGSSDVVASLKKIAEGSTDPFYAAKLQTARFYFARLFPETASLMRTARSGVANLLDTEQALA